MEVAVDRTIAGLRRVLGAETDAELARKLGIDKSTVSGWRARGRVPDRFTNMIDAPEHGVLADLGTLSGELRERAYPVAFARYILIRHELIRSGDADRAMSILRDMKPFWLVLHRAVHELLAKVEALQVELETAQLLLLQEDLRDPEATAHRVNAQIADDLADNPHFKESK